MESKPKGRVAPEQTKKYTLIAINKSGKNVFLYNIKSKSGHLSWQKQHVVQLICDKYALEEDHFEWLIFNSEYSPTEVVDSTEDGLFLVGGKP